MFKKKYGDGHYGIAIPIWFKQRVHVWDQYADSIVIGDFRRHFFITLKFERMHCVIAGVETRLRFGFLYLP